MNTDIRSKIKILLSLLNDDQKTEDVIEITKINNPNIYDYLEKTGDLYIEYNVEYNQIFLPRETEASLSLWNKSLNNTWEINLYNINRMLEAHWK